MSSLASPVLLGSQWVNPCLQSPMHEWAARAAKPDTDPASSLKIDYHPWDCTDEHYVSFPEWSTCIVLASHLCTCVLHRQLCYLHTPKLPQFFHFHGNFHQKWHFAHPEVSFAHPDLPFLAKSMSTCLLNWGKIYGYSYIWHNTEHCQIGWSILLFIFISEFIFD